MPFDSTKLLLVIQIYTTRTPKHQDIKILHQALPRFYSNSIHKNGPVSEITSIT